MSDSVQSHRRQPTMPPRPWDSPGNNTGVGCHFLLQGNLPDPGIKLVSPLSPAWADRFFTTSTTWEAHIHNITL